MIPSLRELERVGVLGPTDGELARALGRLAGVGNRPDVDLAVALASRLVSIGHVCLDLAAPPAWALLRADGRGDETPADWNWPSPTAWSEALCATELVDLVDSVGANDSAGARRPLVLDENGRLYLRRYYEHETALAQTLRERVRNECPVDEVTLTEGLDRLFGTGGEITGSDPATIAEAANAGQRRAAEAALRRRLCVISGGPGTGKTSTVARMLVLAIEQARAGSTPDPRVRLVAPTGKAAAALTAALTRVLATLDCDDDVREAVPREALTLHRALGARGVGSRFRHSAANPIEADFVVVDEASMVDLALMRRLAEAVPETATLVMMGDADQLASVEAGAVLGDICAAGEGDNSAGVLAPAIVRLEHSFRFSAESGIGALSHAVNEGAVEAAFEVMEDARRTDAVWIERGEENWPADVVEIVDAGFAPLLAAGDAETALSTLGRFRLLCPHRAGPLGVDDLNRRLGERFGEPGRQGPFGAEPVLIERNDHALALFNGDMGVRSQDPSEGEGAQVCFRSSEGGLRQISALRLPPHVPCWAMSVHKSQGSEFDDVLVVLPDRESPLLTREMLYTAISRARGRVMIWGSRRVMSAAIETSVERSSGLRDALRAED